MERLKDGGHWGSCKVCGGSWNGGSEPWEVGFAIRGMSRNVGYPGMGVCNSVRGGLRGSCNDEDIWDIQI